MGGLFTLSLKLEAAASCVCTSPSVCQSGLQKSTMAETKEGRKAELLFVTFGRHFRQHYLRV